MAAHRSRSIHSENSLEVPYGLIGWVGESSEARPEEGMPYTAAVEENTKCFTPAAEAASSSERSSV